MKHVPGSLPPPATAGFTLVELTMVLALVAGLFAATMALAPRSNTAPDMGNYPAKLATAIEAARTQALAERVSVTLTGTGDRLNVTTADGTEASTFPTAALSGSIAVQADGSSSGRLTILGNNLPCQSLNLSAGGSVDTASCDGAATAPTTEAAAPGAIGTVTTGTGGPTVINDTAPSPTPVTPLPSGGTTGGATPVECSTCGPKGSPTIDPVYPPAYDYY